jgi:short-chain Z-isoprenyl diphosphate synthase
MSDTSNGSPSGDKQQASLDSSAERSLATDTSARHVPATLGPRRHVDVGKRRGQLPRHVGIVLDGNRRWARTNHIENESEGHRIGFAKIPDVLSWCDAAGIEVVTLWMLSPDNIKSRSQGELDALYEIDEDVVRKLMARGTFRVRFIGEPSLLPARLVAVLREAEEATRSVKRLEANLAIAYGGREELLGAIEGLVQDAMKTGNTSVTPERLAAHLHTAGQPDPDLIIRTSGEHRTSGFLLWQAALSELFFCDCFWPDFSEADLHRALSAYSNRDRRFGG